MVFNSLSCESIVTISEVGHLIQLIFMIVNFAVKIKFKTNKAITEKPEHMSLYQLKKKKNVIIQYIAKKYASKPQQLLQLTT